MGTQRDSHLNKSEGDDKGNIENTDSLYCSRCKDVPPVLKKPMVSIGCQTEDVNCFSDNELQQVSMQAQRSTADYLRAEFDKKLETAFRQNFGVRNVNGT